MKIVFVSNNQNKLKEIQSILSGKKIEVIPLSDVEEDVEIEETESTLEGNAELKAKYVWDKFKLNAFADDTGLEVMALDNEPGVYSARYAGEKASSSDNINKLMFHMDGESNRKAKFRTSICLILDGKTHFFEGVVEGEISQNIKGNGGFGYDSIFIPKGYNRSFGQMSPEEKNKLSHRKVAIKKMSDFLKDL